MIKSITQYLDDTALRFPDKKAFVDTSEYLTFSKLREEARKWASIILEIIPMRSPVVIYTQKKAWDVVLFMGAAYAGCYYVPIDVDMPTERVQMILDQLDSKLIICDQSTQQKIDNYRHKAVVKTDHESLGVIPNESALKCIRDQLCITDLLYVLFTSGSTGVPKGVTISHGAAIDFVEWIQQEYNLDESFSFCNQAPFYFDASVPDLLIPLKCGSTTFIPPKSYYTFPKKILQYIVDNQINTLVWVPSALCNVVNCKALSLIVPYTVKLVIFCGEVMPCKHLNVWRKALPETQFVNMYGPTEATYACMYYNIQRSFSDDEVLPLGKPCGNTRVLLLNDDKKIAQPGEPGEIVVIGMCLSNGYFKNPKQTQKVFIQNPENDKWNEIAYLTGDLAVCDKNGIMTYIGRKDSQIKRLGHRIELGEIEHVVSAVSGIKSACCLFDELTEDILLFYDGSLESVAIEENIKNKLPRYMYPTKWFHLTAMPMNINGKIDRVLLKTQYLNK